VLGLSGPMAAGKTTVAKFLERTGFRYCRFSEVLAEELRASGTSVNRSTLQAAGEKVFNSRFGQRRLQNKLAQKVEGAARIVVDGLRHPEDWAFVRERWGFAAIHIHITAGIDLRGMRYAERPGESSSSFLSASAHDVERNVPIMERLADQTLVNTGSVKGLETRMDALVSGWRSCQ